MKIHESLDLSLPQSRVVCGYEITRAPLGAFLRAVRQAQHFPSELLSAVFPRMNVQEILLLLKSCDGEALGEILVRAMAVVPEQAVRLVAGLTGIPEDRLRDDPAIGLEGLAEIAAAWFEVNRIENFTQTAAGLWQKLRAQSAGKTNTGSSISSPEP